MTQFDDTTLLEVSIRIFEARLQGGSKLTLSDARTARSLVTEARYLIRAVKE